MKKKFSWKSFLVLLGIVVVLLAGVSPYYIGTLERAKAGAAEAALVNVAAAENLYFIHHQVYTNDWHGLERYIPQNAEMQGIFAPAAEPGEERFFAFSQQDIQSGRNGFSFGIELNEDASAGKIYAVRSGGPVQYTLVENFPKPVFACEADGWAGRIFCKKFSAYIAPFLMRNTSDTVTQQAVPEISFAVDSASENSGAVTQQPATEMM